MKSKRIVKKGMFDHNSLTVNFGGDFSTPENIFTAQAVKVPTFKHTYREKEDAGGGAYYSHSILTTEEIDNAFIILRESIVIGWMMPYAACHNIKSELWPLDRKHTYKEVKRFAETLKINHEHN